MIWNMSHIYYHKDILQQCVFKQPMKVVYRVCLNVLYENINQIFPNKLHGPIHYVICVTYVYNGHVLYTRNYVVITRQSNPPISQLNSSCHEFTSVLSMCVYNNNHLMIILSFLFDYVGMHSWYMYLFFQST